MNYSKNDIENLLDECMCYDIEGNYIMHKYIKISVKSFKEALKISKLFKVYMYENEGLFNLYTKQHKKVLKLHKIKIKTLKLTKTLG